jgi:hypothetical protein
MTQSSNTQKVQPTDAAPSIVIMGGLGFIGVTCAVLC